MVLSTYCSSFLILTYCNLFYQINCLNVPKFNPSAEENTQSSHHLQSAKSNAYLQSYDISIPHSGSDETIG